MKGLQYSTGQVHKLSLHEAFQQVIRQEGMRALWKGNGVTMLHRLPYSAVNFWAYEQFTQQWHLRFPSAVNHSQDAVLRRLLAGGAAGMCACTLVGVLHNAPRGSCKQKCRSRCCSLEPNQPALLPVAYWHPCVMLVHQPRSCSNAAYARTFHPNSSLLGRAFFIY